MGIKNLQVVNLSNNYFFFRTMSEPDLCKLFLEKLLKIEIEKVDIHQSEKVLNFSVMGKGVRLDVYLKDSFGTVYQIEMQSNPEYDLGKRARYYQSMIDTDELEKGMKYRQLPKSFVIFVCTKDYFGMGRHLYTFKTTCEQEPGLPFNDEAYKIVLNTKGTMRDLDDELIEFLKYVDESTDEMAQACQGDLVRQFHEKVKVLRKDKSLEVEIMTVEELLEERWERGRAEGLEQGLVKAAKNLKDEGLEDDLIAKVTGLALEVICKL